MMVSKTLRSLDVTSKDLAEDIKTPQELHHKCIFEAEIKSRGE